MLSDIIGRRNPEKITDEKSEGRRMGITVNAGKMPVFQKIRQGGLKSTKEKMERQQNRDNEVAVLEKQKAALKNKECGSLEDIEDKLELFYSYEDQIRAVKHAFNSEQMNHILDEAREKGEKIAEELKKHFAKTPEELKKILEEEALGIEESQGMLSELLEELTQEMPEELPENAAEELAGEIADESTGKTAEEPEESITEKRIREAAEKITEERIRGSEERTETEVEVFRRWDGVSLIR